MRFAHHVPVPESTSPQFTGRIASLEALRLVAAVVVVLGHLSMHEIWLPAGGQAPWYLAWTQLGHLSVLLFFALSGYVLTHGVLHPDQRPRWMLRRLRRLLPLYYVALLVPVISDAVVQRGLRDVGSAVLSVLLLAAVIPHAGADARNAPLWSLQVEVWLSLLLWLWALSSPMRKRGPRGAAAIAASSLLIDLALQDLGLQLLDGVPFFFAGVSLALLGCSWSTAWTRMAFAVALPLVVFAAPWYVTAQGQAASVLAAFLLVLLIVQAAASAELPPSLAPVARALGRRTYALYALHWPVILAVCTVLPSDTSFRTAAAILSIVMATELAHRFIDTAAVRWARAKKS